MDKISVIVPCYNEQEAIPIFYKEIVKTAEELRGKAELQVLFVNDGSKDASLAEMKRLAGQDPRIKYVSFSRNFGKEAAMYAGLSYADGDYVAIMDVDLQDPPVPFAGNVPDYYGGALRLRGDETGDTQGRAAYPLLFRAPFLRHDAPAFQDGDRGRGQGLPADDAAVCR